MTEYGFANSELSKSFLPGGAAKPITSMTSKELKAVKTFKGVRKPIRSAKKQARINEARKGMSNAKEVINSGGWEESGKNVFVRSMKLNLLGRGFPEGDNGVSGAKKLQAMGAIPKKAKRPTYFEHQRTGSYGGFTQLTGGKRDPALVVVSSPEKGNGKVQRFIAAHEGAHAAPIRSSGRMQQIANNPKKIIREEARADATAIRSGASEMKNGSHVSGYAQSADIDRSINSRNPLRSRAARSLKASMPSIAEKVKAAGLTSSGYKKPKTGSYLKMRSKLGQPVKQASVGSTVKSNLQIKAANAKSRKAMGL